MKIYEANYYSFCFVAANMAQLEIPSNRSEFSVDHIKYNREGGCFVSYKKLGISIFTIIICIIAAGFIGAKISSLPDKKVSHMFRKFKRIKLIFK